MVEVWPTPEVEVWPVNCNRDLGFGEIIGRYEWSLSMLIARRFLLTIFACGLASATMTRASMAEDWPSRQVSFLVPTAAGGNTDLMARFAAEYLQNKFGKPFVVINKPSAGGVLTTEQTVTSPADGYTILFAPSSMVLLTPLVQQISVDPEKQLVPVTNVGTGSQVLAVKRSLPVSNLTEFLDYARSHPGKLNFVVAGVNNISHLGPVLLFKRAKVDLVMVPQRGEPQAINDLMSGDVDAYFGNASVLLQQANSDKLKLLAVGTPDRISAAPELPTISETIPGFNFSSWNGFFVATGTPEPIISSLRQAVTEMVGQPELQKRLRELGIVPGGQSEAQVKSVFDHDREAFAAAVTAAGVKKQ
jgi:tripartite-type tricarboxylate transporter receptor subunit TctC